MRDPLHYVGLTETEMDERTMKSVLSFFEI